MPASPLPLVHLGSAQAQACSAIAQRAQDLPLTLGGSAWLARLQPQASAQASADMADMADGHWLQWEWAGAQFLLGLPPLALQQALSAQLGHVLLPDGREFPPELAQDLLQAGLAELLQALQALGRGQPQLRQWWPAGSGLPPAPWPAHALALQLQAQGGPEAFSARLWADDLGLLLLAGLLAQRPPRPGPLQVGLPVRLRAEIGSTPVSVDELRSLALGDVLLLQTAFIGPARQLWLSADGHAGLLVQCPQPADSPESPPPAAEPADLSLTVLQAWSDRMPAATPDAADAAEAANTTPVASLADLPVRLSFDLGELTLTLAQLQALQPGQALALGRPLAGAVQVRANGVLIGAGELVQIDGQLGVSLSHLWADGGAP